MPKAGDLFVKNLNNQISYVPIKSLASAVTQISRLKDKNGSKWQTSFTNVRRGNEFGNAGDSTFAVMRTLSSSPNESVVENSGSIAHATRRK